MLSSKPTVGVLSNNAQIYRLKIKYRLSINYLSIYPSIYLSMDGNTAALLTHSSIDLVNYVLNPYNEIYSGMDKTLTLRGRKPHNISVEKAITAEQRLPLFLSITLCLCVFFLLFMIESSYIYTQTET